MSDATEQETDFERRDRLHRIEYILREQFAYTPTQAEVQRFMQHGSFARLVPAPVNQDRKRSTRKEPHGHQN